MIRRDSHLIKNRDVTLPLTCLNGIGAQRARLFAQKNIHTILDLLFFTPLRYEDRTRISPIKRCKENVPALVKGNVISGKEARFYPSRKRLFKILIQDGEGTLELLWFHYRKQHLNTFITPDQELLAYGEIKINKNRMQMIHPEVFMLKDKGIDDLLGFYPVYSSVTGVTPNMVRKTVRNALQEYLGYLTDPIPEKITKGLSLPALSRAVQYVHVPPVKSSIELLNQSNTPFHRRLLFDRFFLIMVTIAYRTKLRENKRGTVYSISSGLMENIKDFFPFTLTSHQITAVHDIRRDVTSGKPMNRLLMGDVGCGKTVIAAIAAFMTVHNTMQAAIMAPTQFLARQHMDYFSGLSKKTGLSPVLLAGRLKTAEHRDIYDKIKTGVYNLIIGTQSLIQENLVFDKLGLVVIDEQHKFGVRERALLGQKGENPHLLVMTATPIPRTLAITAYGDMQISTIKEYPEQHTPVATYIVRQKQKKRVYEILTQKISSGQQAFVVCPVIEAVSYTHLTLPTN